MRGQFKKLALVAIGLVSMPGALYAIEIGSCYETKGIPGVQIKIKSVSDEFILATGNLSPIPISYKKVDFLESIKLGSSIKVACVDPLAQATKAGNKKSSAAPIIFGYDLRLDLEKFKKAYADKVLNCDQAVYRNQYICGAQSDGCLRKQWEYSKSESTIDVCNLKENIKVTFSRFPDENQSSLMELSKDLNQDKLDLEVVKESIEKKLGINFPQYEAIVNFHSGKIQIEYEFSGVGDKKLAKKIIYKSTPDLNQLINDREKKLIDHEKQLEKIENEKKAKQLNI